MSFIKTYYPRQIFESGFLEKLSRKLPPFENLLEGAKAVEALLIDLFDIKDIYKTLQATIRNNQAVDLFRKRILQKTIPYKILSSQVIDLPSSHFKVFLEMKDQQIAHLALTDLTPELALYCAWRLWSPAAPDKGIFSLPKKPSETYPFSSSRPIHRTDFNLFHPPSTLEETYLEATYCLHCHNTQKDSCRTGLKDTFKEGCPLDLPISEMNQLYAQGHPLAALVIMIVKNPMILATGHRICNDCMQSCIYQQQDPVNVPAIESYLVRACLDLPWGFEIIYLLSYWCPLYESIYNNPRPKATLPRTALVVGMGPAGFTLAHQLLSFGYRVVGMEALAISPLDSSLLTQPIYNFSSCELPLEERIPHGFGGVMEYGITARWNKNFLTALRIILERHPCFSLLGAQIFGESFSFAQAFKYGFDHVTLALGAGKPKIPSIEKNLAKGVRLASDFLMSLHQGQSFKDTTQSPLWLESPVVIIGGGLTAMDAATEALVLLRVQASTLKKKSENISPHLLSAEDKNRLGNLIQNEFPSVTLIYRKAFEEAPSLKQNSPEVKAALAQGIKILDQLTPLSFQVDERDYVTGVQCQSPQGEIIIPARSVILATGTHPHSIKENSLDFSRTRSFQDKISLIGDLDPTFQGSVVKAISSAMQAAPSIHKALQALPPSSRPPVSFKKLHHELTAILKDIREIAKGIYEINVHAPFAARNFQAGQFFRVSSYSTSALPSLSKPLALSGIKREGPLLTLLLAGKSTASYWLRQLPSQTPLALMGPVGKPSFIPVKKRVLLMGWGLGNAILLPILKAMKAAGCYVDYIAYFPQGTSPFYEDQLRQLSDSFCSIPGAENDLYSLPSLLRKGVWDHALLIGPPKFMKYFSDFLKEDNKAKKIIVAVNTSMFCMMQGVCGQCLQRQVTAKGEEKWVFTCTQQDQEAHLVDFAFLDSRLSQNQLIDKLNFLSCMPSIT